MGSKRGKAMKSVNEWYGIIKDYALETKKPFVRALNEVFQSDEELTDEQFDELETLFRKDL